MRTELTDAQKKIEPRNADSHLTYIGAGLRNCVTYRTRPGAPVYFIELDGKSDVMRRQRTTTVLAYDAERIVSRTSVRIPISKHPIDSVNLGDPRLGLLEQVNDLLARSGLDRGRVDLVVAPDERHVGLTVNEYETLLMQSDLMDVLRNPLRFARIKARNMLDDPLAIPGKTVSYARYDVVRVLNSLMEALRLDHLVRAPDREGDGGAGHALMRSRRVSLSPPRMPIARQPARARDLSESDPGPVAAAERQERHIDIVLVSSFDAG